MHRAQFQQVLLQHLSGASAEIHMQRRLVSFKQPPSCSQPIHLSFEDGSRATCDILVGADGIKSVVRERMLTAVAEELRARGRAADADEALRQAKPVWSGTMAYRTTIPAEVLQRRYPNHRVLTTAHVVSEPARLQHVRSRT